MKTVARDVAYLCQCSMEATRTFAELEELMMGWHLDSDPSGQASLAQRAASKARKLVERLGTVEYCWRQLDGRLTTTPE